MAVDMDNAAICSKLQRAINDARRVLAVVDALRNSPAGVPPVGVRMDFGMALQALKSGVRVCRSGWNGKGMWLHMVCEFDWTCGKAVAAEVRHLPWIGMKTADGGFVPWLASQTDMIASDWQIVVEG